MAEVGGIQQEATATVSWPEGTDIAFLGPAPFVNKTSLSLTQVTARFAFLEGGPDGILHFRAAICMQIDDLKALSELINQALEMRAKQLGEGSENALKK